MKLPHLNRPQRYVGLVVLDLGPRVNLGYTPAEAEALLAHPQYSSASAYLIHACRDDGSIELVGLSLAKLSQPGAMAFPRADLPAAEADYDALRADAQHRPLPCSATLLLTGHDTGPITGLIYPAASETAITDWLGRSSCRPGDTVLAGAGAMAKLAHATRREMLPVAPLRQDRTIDALLVAIDQPLQR